jgi:hypothetical protein
MHPASTAAVLIMHSEGPSHPIDVFVLGNGRSRLRYDLETLRRAGRIYGCNALYRDFAPDVLVAIDRRMIDEIVASGYSRDHCCYFANDERGLSVPPDCLVGEPGRTRYAGPAAIRLAIRLEQPRRIFLIGFDIVDIEWNNIYAGTPGYEDYRDIGKRIVETGKYVGHNPATLSQLRDIFLEFPQIQFCKLMNSSRFRYPEWKGVRNLVYLTLDQIRKLRIESCPETPEP